MLKLSDPVTELPFVGEKYGGLLRKLEIKTIENLLHHYPTRYEDYSLISKIDRLQAGEVVTVIGEVSEFKYQPTRKQGFSIQQAQLADDTGELKLTWFNQRFLSSVIKPGTRISVAGTVEKEGNKLTVKNPEYEVLRSARSAIIANAQRVNNVSRIASQDMPLIHTGRLIPVYPETKGVSSRWIRSRIALAIGILDWYQRKYDVTSQITDWLPNKIVQEKKLINLSEALRIIHFPSNQIELLKARERLGFDELLKMQLIALWRKRQWKVNRKSLIVISGKAEANEFIDTLPFKLTTDQIRVIGEIGEDMKKSIPMNRLLQGDVGSGKTVVAAMAVFMAVKAGYQAAFMAPTQVLADQHGVTLTKLLSPFGIKIALLIGGTNKVKIENGNWKLDKDGFPDLIIGTHALIYKRVGKLIDKKRLALVIIDEQHRFGVEQRAQLIAQGSNPHVLSMTATPIPRTIALTAYADLDISAIHRMPVGRIPVKTWVIPEFKRENAYKWILDQIKKNGSQVFVVCPLITESEHESMKQIKAAVSEFNILKSYFDKLKLGLMHGRMAGKEKTKTLTDMREKKIDILVTTPVVEVGVDIPGATIMVIEAAERFGLAQLHQLRGRVGRSDQSSYCLLFSGNAKESRRLKAMTEIYNGLELAQLDLKLRGPGEIFATRQHGFPELKIADLSDLSQTKRAHQAAVRLISEGWWKPKLANSVAAN